MGVTHEFAKTITISSLELSPIAIHVYLLRWLPYFVNFVLGHSTSLLSSTVAQPPADNISKLSMMAYKYCDDYPLNERPTYCAIKADSRQFTARTSGEI